MALFDDTPPPRPTPHRIGEDLATLSIEEVHHRIAILEAEIERLRQNVAAKTKSLAAAASFFKR